MVRGYEVKASRCRAWRCGTISNCVALITAQYALHLAACGALQLITQLVFADRSVVVFEIGGKLMGTVALGNKKQVLGVGRVQRCL